MIVTFEKKYLEELFTVGKASGKKYRFQPEIISNYQKIVRLLRKINDIEELYKYGSYHFEALGNNKKGIYSMRVNNKYRVEFTIAKNTSNITICNILELSNHYK